MRIEKIRSQIVVRAFSIACSALFAAGAFAADSTGEPGRESGKPTPLNNVYFGEQHLHTQDSPDAFAMGTRNTQDDAYNFCKGKAIKKSTTGEMVQKKTPYDWCAVTDHALLLGLLPKTLGIPPLDTVPATIQERAWASPIWYTPDPSVVTKAPSYPGLRNYLPE